MRHRGVLITRPLDETLCGDCSADTLLGNMLISVGFIFRLSSVMVSECGTDVMISSVVSDTGSTVSVVRRRSLRLHR